MCRHNKTQQKNNQGLYLIIHSLIISRGWDSLCWEHVPQAQTCVGDVVSSVCAHVTLFTSRKDAVYGVKPKISCIRRKNWGRQLKPWSPLRRHLARVGSSILLPFWQNMWEWWRPLDRIHGLASQKVECQRSVSGQPICRSGSATLQAGC